MVFIFLYRNYGSLGTPTDPDPSTLVLSELRMRHPEAFSRDSEKLLEEVLSEAILPFSSLSDFQVLAVYF